MASSVVVGTWMGRWAAMGANARIKLRRNVIFHKYKNNQFLGSGVETQEEGGYKYEKIYTENMQKICDLAIMQIGVLCTTNNSFKNF